MLAVGAFTAAYTPTASSDAAALDASRHPVTPHPSVPSSMTPEQKLDQLDELAAGGYITPAEYQARRKAILDSR